MLSTPLSGTLVCLSSSSLFACLFFIHVFVLRFSEQYCFMVAVNLNVFWAFLSHFHAVCSPGVSLKYLITQIEWEGRRGRVEMDAFYVVIAEDLELMM